MHAQALRPAGHRLLRPSPAAAHAESYPQVPSGYHVQFGAGHVLGNNPAFAIQDDFNSPVGALICQDTNGDTVCGGPGEFSLAFCGSASGGQLDPNFPVHVFVDNLLTLLPQCGPLQFGFTGQVGHT